MTRFVTTILMLAVATAPAGCSAPGRPNPVALRAGSITEAEAINVARRFERAVAAQDVAAVRDLIDEDEVRRRVCEAGEISGADREACRATFGDVFDFAGLIMQPVAGKGRIKLLRLFRTGPDAAPLLRIVDDEGRLHYLVLQLARGGDGLVRVVDAGSPWEQETATVAMRRFWLMVQSPDADRHFEADARLHMEQLILAGRLDEAYEMWASMPDAVRAEQPVMLAHLQYFVPAFDRDGLLGHLQSYRRRRPGDLAADLAVLPELIWSQHHDEALRVVSSLRAAVGGDGYLDLIAGQIHRDRGDLTQARRVIAHAVEVEPDLIEAQWERLDLAVGDGDYDLMVECLADLEALGADIGTVLRDDGLQAFRDSEAFQHWQDQRATRTQAE